MAYCTAAEVASEFKDITFSSTTSIKDTDVTAFIDRAGAFVDARAGLKYATPITGTAALLIIKQIVLDMVVGKIKNIMQVKTGDPKVDQGASGDGLIKSALAQLKMIVDEDILLKDAPAATVTSPVASYTAANAATYTPLFDIEKTQW